MNTPVRRRTIAHNQEEGTVNVSSSVGTSKNKVESKPTSLSIPSLRPIPQDPAYVSVGLGMTEALPTPYEFLRMDVRVTLPCGCSDKEIRETASHCGMLAAEFINDERNKALGTEGFTA
jgi:hypothetical protein